MSAKEKAKDLTILKIKRGAVVCLGMVFFLSPGQNWYARVNLVPQLPKVQSIAISIPAPADYPINFLNSSPPGLTARAVVVIDQDSAVMMTGKNEKTRLLPASTVKLMTALVTLDYYHLDDILTVGEIRDLGQDIKLIKGEKITAKNLLYGLLVSSANDAALVLAQNYPGGETAFLTAMNQKAQELSLNDTHFANPTGLDSDEKGSLLADYSYTTALDLARLSALALQNETLSQMVATPKILISDISGKTTHLLYNLNELLGKIEGVKGVKTGWTQLAGECLVGYTERNNRGIITVVLGSQDRFGETAKLINWAFASHRWESLTPSI